MSIQDEMIEATLRSQVRRANLDLEHAEQQAAIQRSEVAFADEQLRLAVQALTNFQVEAGI